MFTPWIKTPTSRRNADAKDRPPVFLAIDFEKLDNITKDSDLNAENQVGLAIFDPKNLNSSVLNPNRLIPTFNFASGSLKYCSTVSRKFLFGISKTIKREEMLTSINSLIPSASSIILVGHHIATDLQALRALDFDFRPVIAVLDTLRIGHEVLQQTGSLRDLLIKLECPFNMLHCAGNDAHFTLRVLLLLAAASTNDLAHSQLQRDLRRLGHAPIPLRVDPHTKASRKKEKRLQKSRKHQSRSWSIEKQDTIRAEQAARRSKV